MSEHQHGPSDDAAVVLDIGGDVGALIIHTGPELLGVELEIAPAGEGAEDVFQAEHPHEHTHTDADGHTHTHSHTPGTTHVAVRERRGPDGSQYAAVYPGLREGSYTVLAAAGRPAETVRITGGEVAELDWT